MVASIEASYSGFGVSVGGSASTTSDKKSDNSKISKKLTISYNGRINKELQDLDNDGITKEIQNLPVNCKGEILN